MDKNKFLKTTLAMIVIQTVMGATAQSFAMPAFSGSKISIDSKGVEAGDSLIRKMHSKSSNLKSYYFNYKMIVFKKNRKTLEKGTFYYKKPGLIRLEEKGPYKKGAVCVLGKSGKVKAHLGGTLKFFVVELSSSSHLLKSANGHPMVESDIKSLTNYLVSYLKEGMHITKTVNPVRVSGIKEKVFILDIRKDKSTKHPWKQIAVNPNTYLPVAWWDYKQNGDIHSHNTWVRFVKNKQLPDELFTIKHAKSAKKQLEESDYAKTKLTEREKAKNSNPG